MPTGPGRISKHDDLAQTIVYAQGRALRGDGRPDRPDRSYDRGLLWWGRGQV